MHELQCAAGEFGTVYFQGLYVNLNMQLDKLQCAALLKENILNFYRAWRPIMQLARDFFRWLGHLHFIAVNFQPPASVFPLNQCSGFFRFPLTTFLFLIYCLRFFHTDPFQYFQLLVWSLSLNIDLGGAKEMGKKNQKQNAGIRFFEWPCPNCLWRDYTNY